MQLEVLYEDNHIIAVNKRPSDIVQGDKTGDTPLSDFVKQYIKEKYNTEVEVVQQNSFSSVQAKLTNIYG